MDSRWSWLLVLLIGCTALPVRGQAPTASIRGLVSAADNGESLVGANVVVTRLGGERAGAVATDVDGFYEIRNLEPGRYRIRVSYVGFQTHRDTVSLDDGVRRYNVTMAPVQQTLEEVEVEAQRGAAQRTAGIQTVSAADLARVPTPGPVGDLASYLQTLPGVVSVGDRGGALYIRGGTPSQNLVLVDGLRIVKPFHISGFYSAFPESIVKQAEVKAGGFGAEHMEAVSSVIDVTLRKGNLQEYQASASASPFLTSLVVEGPIRKGTDSFLGSARYSLIDQADGPIYGRDVPLRFYDLTARYSLQTSTAACNLTGVHTGDEGQINPDRNLTLSWTNTTVGGRCLFFGESIGHDADVRLGYTRFQNEAGPPDNPRRFSSFERGYFDFESEQDLFRNTFRYGGKWTVTRYRFDIDEKFTAVRADQQIASDLQAYVSMDFDFGDKLTLTPSVGSHLTMRRFSSPTIEPRLRATYRPDGTDRREISLALGKYNQLATGITDERDAGTVFTLWTPSGDDNPVFEDEPILEALHAILGYRQRIGDYAEVSVEGYAKRLSNVVVPKWSPVARFDTETTLADGAAYGGDVRVEYDRGPLYFYTGYGWSTVTYRAAREDLGAWIDGRVFEYHPPHDRRHQLNATLSYELGAYTGNLNWKVTSGRPYTQVSGFDFVLDLPSQFPTQNSGTASVYYDRPYNARLPYYHRLDVSVERSFNLSSDVLLDAQVGAINGYNRRNIFYFDTTTLKRVDQTPVLPYVSLRLRLE